MFAGCGGIVNTKNYYATKKECEMTCNTVSCNDFWDGIFQGDRPINCFVFL